jgi:hypothetical protein
VTLGLGAGPYVGNHTSPDGTVSGGGVPIPLIELDAPLGAVQFHAEGVPYARTRYYGNLFDPSYSVVEAADATLRLYERNRRLAFGVGYGALFSSTYRTAPPSTLSFEGTGVRMELHARIPTSALGRLELTFGGLPLAHGTLTTNLGIPGSSTLHDAVDGAQIDATVRETLETRRALSFAYGVRYVNQTFVYANSQTLVERNAAVLPFVEVRLRL